jgi:predicted TIM-barrel fold metal-dependent hydrolase
MIVDVHYHFIRWPSDEQKARDLVAGFVHSGSRSGIKKTIDEVMPFYRESINDPEGYNLVKRMDEGGIDVTAICIVDNINYGYDNDRILRINQYCASAAAKHPGRLIALAGIDPRRAGAPLLFRRCIEEFGMKGLKWHPDDGYYPNGEEAYKVLKVANELGVPLLTHTGPLGGSRAKYSHPIHLDDVALDFPNVTIIAAHMGDIWWHDWAAIAKHKPNICGDLAMWQETAETRPHLFRRYLREIVDIVGAERVLFASDAPIFEPFISNRRWIEILKGLSKKGADGISFTNEEIKAILGGNATRIFKLKT